MNLRSKANYKKLKNNCLFSFVTIYLHVNKKKVYQ